MLAGESTALSILVTMPASTGIYHSLRLPPRLLRVNEMSSSSLTSCLRSGGATNPSWVPIGPKETYTPMNWTPAENAWFATTFITFPWHHFSQHLKTNSSADTEDLFFSCGESSLTFPSSYPTYRHPSGGGDDWTGPNNPVKLVNDVEKT